MSKEITRAWMIMAPDTDLLVGMASRQEERAKHNLATLKGQPWRELAAEGYKVVEVFITFEHPLYPPHREAAPFPHETVGPNVGKVADALNEALEAVDPEFLTSEIEKRSREMVVKTHIGLGGDVARGFHDGFTYGLLWGGVLSEKTITEAHKLIARAHPNCPFYKIDGRTLRSLRQRGWVQSRLPLLTDLGLEVVKKFWPEQLERSE